MYGFKDFNLRKGSIGSLGEPRKYLSEVTSLVGTDYGILTLNLKETTLCCSCQVMQGRHRNTWEEDHAIHKQIDIQCLFTVIVT